MKGRTRNRLRSVLSHAALAAGCALYACLPLSGCMGGTSTEMGNPSLTLDFRSQGKPIAFDGILRIVAAGSNPEFYYAPPEDGITQPDNTSPELVITTGGVSEPSVFRLPGFTSFTLDKKQLAQSMFQRDQLRLLKRGANEITLRDFNVILQPSDSSDSLGGWLAEVHADSQGYRSAAGDSGVELTIDLTPGHRCSGEVDTGTSAGKPLALFVPGSPYYALVHAGHFEFTGLPAGRLPLRWVARTGRVFAVAESLGLAGGGDTPLSYSLPNPVRAGEQIDSIAIPDPNPRLSSPVASPAGGDYTFSDSVAVMLRAANGAEIHFTTDGSTPTRESNTYVKPIILHASTTLFAVAYAKGFEPSPISENNYQLVPAAPTFTPGAGSFVDSVKVEISGPAGATVYYTLDGSKPSDSSLVYANGPIVLHSSALIQAVSIKRGLGSSSVVSSQYVIVPDTAAAPPAHP